VVWLPRNKTEIRDEKLSHYKCSKCHKMGQLAMSCPNKKEKKQHDSSEDDSKISQVQVNVNFEVGDKLGRKKTRRGGRRRNRTKTSPMSTINAIRRGILQRIVPNVTNLSQVQLMKTICLGRVEMVP